MDEPVATSIDDLDEELHGLVKPELGPDERLLWAARGIPRYGAPGWAWEAFWALGLGALCFGIFYLSMHSRFRNVDAFLVVVGLTSGVIGLFGTIQARVSWRFEGRRLRRAVYALTEQRAIAWRPYVGSNGIAVESYPPANSRKCIASSIPTAPRTYGSTGHALRVLPFRASPTFDGSRRWSAGS